MSHPKINILKKQELEYLTEEGIITHPLISFTECEGTELKKMLEKAFQAGSDFVCQEELNIELIDFEKWYNSL